METPHIERDAELVLADYGKAQGAATAPPVLVDEIVETYPKSVVEMLGAHRTRSIGPAQSTY